MRAHYKSPIKWYFRLPIVRAFYVNDQLAVPLLSAVMASIICPMKPLEAGIALRTLVLYGFYRESKRFIRTLEHDHAVISRRL